MALTPLRRPALHIGGRGPDVQWVTHVYRSLDEEPKPAGLAARGGCWFRSGAVRLHLGVEADFRAARKAHPALRVSGFAELLADLREAGCTVREDGAFEGAARVYVDDPFGNRIELIADK